MKSQALNSYLVPGANYGYTGISPDNVADFENTIVTGLFDESGSTRNFARDMENCVKQIIKFLRTSPDKLLYRHVHFDTTLREVHGFKPLVECNENDYDNIWNGGGATSLYNSIDNVLKSTVDYAEKHSEAKRLTNGFVFIITDGANYLPNGISSLTQEDVKMSLARAITSEALESLITILIGVNPDDRIQDELKQFHQNAGFTGYVSLLDASPKSFGKIAGYLSQSVQSQMQSLGSGGPSQLLTF